ncbi:MAG: DUF4760 domain-containing protein [Caldilineales bacterium]|nr:DUF4760 domain-containing protein [Caldilineales bacterium]
MESRRSKYLTLVISLLIILGVFGCSLFFLLVARWLAQAADIPADFWVMAEALATLFAAAAVIGAGYLAFQELRAQASLRHIDVADKLFAELNSPANVDSRRWIYQDLPEFSPAAVEGLSEEGREHVKRVLNSLDRVAFLSQGDWIPDEMIMPWMSFMVVKSWDRLAPYVEFERQRRGDATYYEMVDELAGRCREWRQAQGLKAEFTQVDGAL